MNTTIPIPWPKRREDINPAMLDDMVLLIAEATGQPEALISEAIGHIVDEHYRTTRR